VEDFGDVLGTNLRLILGVVDLGRCFESIFGAHHGWGRFGGCFGSKFGDVFGNVKLSWIQGWWITRRYFSRLSYTKCMKHEHLKPIGIRKKKDYDSLIYIYLVVKTSNLKLSELICSLFQFDYVKTLYSLFFFETTNWFFCINFGDALDFGT
jgi:hypothetical protein